MKAKSKGTATPIVPKSAVPDVSPITNPLALPDSPFPALGNGENPCGKQYLDRIGKWYEHYYLQTFRTFTRAGIGKCMHPGYCHMDMCISLLTKGIVYVPQSERVRYYAPLKFVLDAIAHTWTDATAPALGALAHVQELQDAYNIDVDAPRSQDWIDKHCERIDRETDGLKDDLRKLSEILLSGTAKQSGEILAAVQDVKRELVAARGDIADSEERTQNMMHQKFQELELTKDQVSYLAGKKTTRSINGKKAQAKANADPDIAELKQRAAEDMKRAVDRVRERVLEHEKRKEKYNLLEICRRACKTFTPLTNKKNELGKFEEYAPLLNWQRDPIQPDTLRKHYTARFGTKKEKRSQDHAKPKTSTKPKVKHTSK